MRSCSSSWTAFLPRSAPFLSCCSPLLVPISKSVGHRRPDATTSPCSTSTRSTPTPPPRSSRCTSKSDPHELVAELRDRSGGNPLFIEELAALIRDSDGAIGADGAQAFDSGDLPVTLRGLVAARLGTLRDP